MRLKKLELFGFKSFADRTEVLFDEGVTCVVGPNGCGKSNISDAIRWVLGERSAKLLRGSKMEDVIFNGTDFRKPVGLAEVSLTIDNTDRGLPIDYQEVTLTRRLYRSGESEYLINRTACRLKDIQDLILDTGIGSSAYSMIEQGRIDYILNADAQERRFLIEEAAGISKFKVKKEEAIRKLERTEENLLRLNDIIQEVFKNIQYAERQAKRAEKYKLQFEELKKLEIQKAYFDLACLAREKAVCDGEFREVSVKRDQFESQQTANQQTVEKLESELEEISQRFSQEEQRFFGLKLRIDQNDQQLRFNQEKRVELATRRGESQLEESQIKERLQKSRLEIETRRKDFEGFEREKQTVLEKIQSSEATLNRVEQELDAAKQEREKGKNELFQVVSETLNLKNEYHRLAAWIETSEEQKKRLGINRQRFNSEKEIWQTKGQGYIQELGVLEQKISNLEVRIKEQEIHAVEWHVKISGLEVQRERAEDALRETQIRLQMLKEMDAAQKKEQAGSIFESIGLEKDLLRSLREVVTVQKGYELALEAALGVLAQAWIVENFETLEKIIPELVHQKGTGLSLLIREMGAGGGTPLPKERPALAQIECALAEVVSFAPSYAALLSPFLDNFYVLRDLDPLELRQIAACLPASQFVTKQGVCLNALGALTFSKAEGPELGVFQRDNEIRELEQTAARLTEETGMLSYEEQVLRNQLSERETALQTTKGEYLDLKIAKEAQESLRTGLDDRVSSYNQELTLLHHEFEEIEEQSKKAYEQKQTLEQDLNGCSEREKVIQEKQDSFFRLIEKLECDRNQALKEVTEFKTRFEHVEERECLLRAALELLLEHEERDRVRLEYLTSELVRIVEKEEALRQSDEALNQTQGEIREQMRKVEVSLELIRQEKKQQEENLLIAEQALEETRENLQKLQAFFHQIEMKAMDLGYQEKGVVEKLEQAYHVKFSELNSDDFKSSDQPMEEVELLIAKLRERVESLGTVNLLAIEEYDELKKRYDFLITQQKDMQDARESLLEAIRKINRTTKTLFEDTFANVQKMFQEYYQVLFRGGDARLVLIDETHPLESGIDIVVRPPGKKPTHITLLSGGEKALTAIALLFALFKIKPSPFCVLDEVDAPLDEANIDRFLTVLRTFLNNSQFIIVTHNRKTIAMGDSLYGVTMEEAGVSKLVSVKIQQEAVTSSKSEGEGDQTAIEATVPA